MFHLFYFLLFIFLSLIISIVLSLLSSESPPEESLALGELMKLTLKNYLLIVSTVLILGLIATLIGLIF